MILIQSSPSGDFQQSRLLARTWLAAPYRHNVSKRPFDGQEEPMPIRKEMRQRYPKDWALRSRFIRFHRAGNRCEWCGVHNYSLREDTGAVVVLTAAHVYDKRPEACASAQPGGTLPAVSPPPRRQGPRPGQAGKGPRSAAGAGDLKRPFGEQPAGLIA